MLNRFFCTKSEGSVTKKASKDKSKSKKDKASQSAPTTPHEHAAHTHDARPVWKKEHYDSQAHMDFCKRWKVTGDLHEYDSWNNFVQGFSYPTFTAAEIAFDTDLTNGNFAKLVLTIKRLPTDICTEANLYALFSNYLRMRKNDAVTMYDKIVNSIIGKIFPSFDRCLWEKLYVELTELYGHRIEDNKDTLSPRSKSSM